MSSLASLVVITGPKTGPVSSGLLEVSSSAALFSLAAAALRASPSSQPLASLAIRDMVLRLDRMLSL